MEDRKEDKWRTGGREGVRAGGRIQQPSVLRLDEKFKYDQFQRVQVQTSR